MKKNLRSVLTFTGIFFLLFLTYFVSEAILRQTAVSRITPNEKELNSIISQLPEKTREDIHYQINMTSLQNAFKAAKTEDERAQILCMIAQTHRDQKECDRLYHVVMKEYPNAPSSYPAYLIYLFNINEDRNIVPLSGYHAYLNRLAPLERYNAWSAGYNKLLSRPQKKATDSEIYEFLHPLLQELPKFRDYAVLLRELADCSRRLKKTVDAQKAEMYYEEALYLPSIMEHMSAAARQ